MAKKTQKLPKKPREPQTMEQLLAEKGIKLHGLKKGEEITGTITSISSKGIYLDIGAKTEGIVLEKDRRILNDLLSSLKVGDKVEASVLNPESDEGWAVLSLRRQRRNKAWQNAVWAREQDEAVEVLITDITRGGVLADFNSLRGFIPSSHLIDNLNEGIIGKSLKVKVLEVDPRDNRLVFSQKAVFLNKEDLKKKLSKIKVTQVYEGTITGITKFGLFVGIAGGVEGLVHISEVSWDKIEDLEKQFKIGDKIQVLVTGVDLQNLKLNLSLKQLLPDPWAQMSRKFATDQQVEGKVARISRIGVFVTLTEGLEGLIHKSKISIGTVLKEGDRVTCIVEGIDIPKRRISLVPVLKEKPMGYK